MFFALCRNDKSNSSFIIVLFFNHLYALESYWITLLGGITFKYENKSKHFQSQQRVWKLLDGLVSTRIHLNVSLSNTHFPTFPVCRVDIRKGLNALKRELPGGDTFMHLGLQRVSLWYNMFFVFNTANQSLAKSKSKTVELAV